VICSLGLREIPRGWRNCFSRTINQEVKTMMTYIVLLAAAGTVLAAFRYGLRRYRASQMIRRILEG